jgi:peroxiredoxin Q/BCP
VAKLEVGGKAPAFRLQDGDGNVVSFPRDVAGARAVLYFYPKDDTPGCTKEACSFRDQIAPLRRLGIRVLGVSADGAESHRRFAAKHKLPFPLLSDPGHVVATEYGAFGEKTLYGKKVVGVIRSTFLLDAQGRIEHIWRKVDTARHAEEVLAKVTALETAKRPGPAADSRPRAPRSRRTASGRRSR